MAPPPLEQAAFEPVTHCITAQECPHRPCQLATCDGSRCAYAADEACTLCDDDGPCDDQSACTEDRCVDHECVRSDLCDDGKLCTTDSCDPLVGCDHDDTCAAPTVTLPEPPLAVNEGAEWKYTLRFTPDPKESWGERPHHVHVDFGDGTPAFDADAAASVELAHTWARDGAFDMKVTVTDADGRADPQTIAVVVANVAPTITFAANAPEQIEEGDRLTTTVTVTDPGQGDLTGDCAVSVAWEEGGEPECLTLQPDGETVVLDHVYRQDSSDEPDQAYVITVFADDTPADADGAVATTHALVVDNAAPTLEGVPDPGSGPLTLSEGSTLPRILTLDDRGDDPLKATIDYGDGRPDVIVDVAAGGGNLVLTFDYLQNNSYHVSVTVADDDTSVTKGFDVKVTNVHPTVDQLDDVDATEGAPWTAHVVFHDPGADTQTVRIDYGDGSPPISQNLGAAVRALDIGKTYPADEDYLVTVTVTDQDNDLGTATFYVHAANVLPQTALPETAEIDEGDTWSASLLAVDPGADTLTGTVRYTAEDTAAALFIDGRRYELAHPYPQDSDDGTLPITVAISDDDGTTTDVLALTVRNVAPVVTCGADTTVAEGAELVRDCTFVDPGADPWTALVDWGDGGDPEAITPVDKAFTLRHVYTDASAPGEAPVVTVTVNDDDASGQASFAVAVGNTPPVIVVDATSTAAEGTPWTLSGTVATALPGDAVTMTADYGDGSDLVDIDVVDHAFELAHTWAGDGDRTVTLTAVDGDGDAAEPQVITVSVANVPPSVDVGDPVTLGEGGTLSRAVTTADLGGDTRTATVDYGLGAGPVPIVVDDAGTLTLSATYPQDGDYEVVVSVLDDGELPSVARLAVTVENVLPTITAGDAGSLDEGGTLSRIVTASDPGADALSASVDYGDGGGAVSFPSVPAEGIALSHVYRQDRATPYTVTVTVQDDTGPSVATFAVTVANLAPTLVAEAPEPADEGAVWTLTGALADAGLDDTFTACVRWTDGGPCEPLAAPTQGELTTSHVYPQDGAYRATVELADEAGGTTSASWDAVIRNVAPTVDSVALTGGLEGAAVQGTVTFTDPGADPHTAVIDWGDGVTEPLGAVSSGFDLGHTWVDDGVYDVVVTVADDDDNATVHHQVTIGNAPPAVALDAATTTIQPGATFTRTGRVTDPGAQDALHATIDWGEGGAVEPLALAGDGSFTLSHPYLVSGPYTVTITATDDDDATTPRSFTVTVSDEAPIVEAQAEGSATEGHAFSRMVGFADPGSSSWFSRVDYGDGSALAPAPVSDAARLVTLDHTYAQDGSYVVTVEVSDDDAFPAATTGSQTFTVVVANEAPVVTLAAIPSGGEGDAVTLAGTFADAGADTWTGSVAWGDGASGPLQVVGKTFGASHAYADEGSYHVVVTITDDHTSGTDDDNATIANVAPRLTLPATVEANVGAAVPISGTIVDPGDDTWTVTVDRGDSSSDVPATVDGRGVSVQLGAYPLPGDYTVTFSVDDGDGGTADETVALHVANVAPTVTAGPNVNAKEGVTVTVSATFSDPGADTHTVTFDWKDGSAVTHGEVDESAHTVSASHAFPDDGVYLVLVTVTDAYDGSNSVIIPCTITNAAPVIPALSDYVAVPARQVQRTLTWTDAGDDTWDVAVRYDLLSGANIGTDTFEDLAVRTVDIDRTLPLDGTYVVTVTVTDDDGGSHQRVFTVTARSLDCAGVPQTGNLWLGGTPGNPTSWGVNANWREGVPTGTAVICGGAADPPNVASDATVDTLLMAPTATVTVASGKRLTIQSELTGGTVAGAGTVVMAGTGTLDADVGLLEVKGAVTALGGGATRLTFPTSGGLVTGAFTVAAGATFSVSGDVTVSVDEDASTGLRMVADGTLAIGGDLALQEAAHGTTAGQLTAGRIELGGDLLETGVTDGTGLDVEGTTFAFTGDDGHTIALTSWKNGGFDDLELTEGSLAMTGGDLKVRGQLTLGSGTTATLDSVSLSAWPVIGPGAVYHVTQTSIADDIDLPADAHLGRPTDSFIIQAGVRFRPNGHTLDYVGFMSVTSDGTAGTGLVMDDPADVVRVGGDLSFTAAGDPVDVDATPRLTAGEIYVAGSLYTVSTFPILTVQGTRIRLGGASQSTPTYVTIDVPAAAGNYLDDVEIVNAVEYRLASDLELRGTLSRDGVGYTGIAEINGGETLTVGNVDMDAVRLVDVPLVVMASGTPSPDPRLDDVIFDADPTLTPLTLAVDELTLTASGLTFTNVPNGDYVVATGTEPTVTPSLTIVDSLPLNGSARTSASNFTVAWGNEGDDTDGDGLSDSDELGPSGYGTDPLLEDTDDDGAGDLLEVTFGTDPNDPDSTAVLPVLASSQPQVGANLTELAVADLDFDGDLDVVVGNANTTNLMTIERNLGAGSFEAMPVPRKNPTPCTGACDAKLALGDLIDEQGGARYLEILAADPAWTYVVRFVGQPGQPPWQIVPDVHEQSDIICNDIADVAVSPQYTGAPWSDAYVVCGSSSTIFHFNFGGGLENPQDQGSFMTIGSGNPHTMIPFFVQPPETYQYVSFAMGQGQVIRGYEYITPPPASSWIITSNATLIDLEAADQNDDGKTDMVYLTEASGNRSFKVARGPNYNNFSGPVALSAGDTRLAVGDLSGDGVADVAVGDFTTGKVTFYIAPNWLPYVFDVSSEVDGVVDLALADVTGDHVLDLVVLGDDGLFVYAP